MYLFKSIILFLNDNDDIDNRNTTLAQTQGREDHFFFFFGVENKIFVLNWM